MCQRPTNVLQLVKHAEAQQAASERVPSTKVLPEAATSPGSNRAMGMQTRGSRRRRLWELGDHAHCPVIGVCMPMPAIRKLVARLAPSTDAADDYDAHCIAVTDSKRRTPLAEAIQKELDQRHALAIRRAAKIKCTEALLPWWRAAVEGANLAEGVWVTLTHPCCTPDLEYRVLGHVHMLQHQVGMACRVDLAHLDAVLHENGVLARHLASVQERSTRLSSEQAAKLDALDTALMRARAELLAKDTEMAQLREQLQTWQSASPDLQTRLALSRDKRDLTEQNQALRRQLLQAEQEAERQKLRAEEALGQLRLSAHAEEGGDAGRDMPLAAPEAPSLGNKAVLCVGGRPAIVPLYRQVVEHTGGRFLHHDGGEEDNTAQLDATLAAADLVICQTACVSNNAYWRVKDHCKRTGKRCVFVDTPSRTALTRALDEVARVLDAGLKA